MIAMPFDRRTAQQFDDLLEGRIAEATQELTKLLAFAEQVWAVPAPEPRADFASSLRARLMEAAPSALAQTATPVADPAKVDEVAAARRRRQIAAAVAAFSVAGAATGTAFAAENSLPGDTLYPIKRLVENAHSTISVGDARKGDVEVGQARTRLSEATELAKDGKTDEASKALEDFVSQAKQGAALLTDAGKGADIHDFTGTSLQQISGLASLLPVDLLTPVLTTVIAIDKAATVAFPGAGDGLTELSNTLTQILNAATSALGKPATSKPATAKPTAKASPTTSAGGAKPTTQPSSKPSTQAGSKPSAKPTSLGGAVGSVGDTVGKDVVGGVGKTVDQVGQGVGGPVGDVVSGLGQTVEGLGQAVDDLLNGVGGALDGKPTK